MSTNAIVVIVVVAVIVVAAFVAAWEAARSRRSRLATKFGPEWDRTVEAQGGPKAAAAELQERSERRARFDIRPLSPAAKDAYRQEWRKVQAGFVDEPWGSLLLADGLVTRVMHESGYPMDNFASSADLVSVDHPAVVGHYRHAHQVFVDGQSGAASTEDMRDAFVSYRALFTELLDGDEDHQSAAVDRGSHSR
jgi:hypothetical protein